MNPAWIGPSVNWTKEITFDGVSYKNETNLVIFGTYFFLSDDMLEHSRQVYTIIQVISDFGGLIDIVIWLFIWVQTIN